VTVVLADQLFITLLIALSTEFPIVSARFDVGGGVTMMASCVVVVLVVVFGTVSADVVVGASVVVLPSRVSRMSAVVVVETAGVPQGGIGCAHG
jgi:hypothetical protein